MDKSIGVGLIIGAVAASSIYVYQSNEFSKVLYDRIELDSNRLDN